MNSYAYRLPGTTTIIAGRTETLQPGIRSGGFVVSRFCGGKEGSWTIVAKPTETEILKMPAEGSTFDGNGNQAEVNTFDGNGNQAKEKLEVLMSAGGFDGGALGEGCVKSSSREAHRDAIEHITAAIGAGELEKCVISRIIRIEGKTQRATTFINLCRAYPEAFVYYFDTPETGAWMGATPELLLSLRDRNIESMALAGTRPADSRGEWDDKNLREQKIVADYIAGLMEGTGLNVSQGTTETRKAGPVEHLMTRIEAETKEEDAFVVACDIAYRLSPTPALLGMPPRKALELIGMHEQFDRECYGGFCGVTDKDGKGLQLYVTIRCMKILEDCALLYAGGGIVKDSSPKAEWEETERKAETLRRHIQISNQQP